MELNVKHLRLTFSTPDGDSTLEGDLQGVLTFSSETPPPPDGDFVTISVGESIQAAVDAHPEGTKFKLRAGVHKQQQVVPKSGNVFEGEAGAVLDGEDTAEFAFRTGNPPYPSNVEIRNLEVRNYASPLQRAAIEAGLYSTSDASDGWIIENNHVHHNGCIGIRIGNRARVVGNNTHHNHCLNISGSGDDALVEGNKIDYGNYEYRYEPGFEAGGTKFTVCRGMVVRGNTCYRNCGPSLWFDEQAIDMTIEGNTIDDCDQEGIVIEICYHATIFKNVITNCGWRDTNNRYTWLWNSGIGIHSSPDCEVYENHVTDCYAGITAIQQDRSMNQQQYGPHLVSNLYVHDNAITQTNVAEGDALSCAAGLAQDIGDTAIFEPDRNNRFAANTYTLGDQTHPFAWADGQRTKDEWQDYGHDTDGTFISDDSYDGRKPRKTRR